MGIGDFRPGTAGVHLPWHCSQPSLLSRKVLVLRAHRAGNKSGRGSVRERSEPGLKMICWQSAPPSWGQCDHYQSPERLHRQLEFQLCSSHTPHACPVGAKSSSPRLSSAPTWAATDYQWSDPGTMGPFVPGKGCRSNADTFSLHGGGKGLSPYICIYNF